MVTDEELLAAVRSAGEPGSESHQLACRLYRRAVLEWREGHAGWREEYATRAGLGWLVAALAEAVELADAARPRPLLRRVTSARCGTSAGVWRHRQEGTETCPRCRKFNRDRMRASRARSRIWRLAESLPVRLAPVTPGPVAEVEEVRRAVLEAAGAREAA